MTVMEGSATVHIAAPADTLWGMVSDVTRMGEWSPETVAAEWVDGATAPAVGVRFKGRNKDGRLRWSTKPKIVECETGKVFAFDTGTTKWTYRFAPAGDGTEVTESFETYKYNPVLKLIASPKKRQPHLQEGIEQTLARLKSVAEAKA